MRADQVAAFVDHRLQGTERAAVESHLAECADCRAEVIEVERLVGGVRRYRTRSLVVGGLAIAAGLLLVVSTLQHRGGRPDNGNLRGAGANAVIPVGPTGVMQRSGLALTWHGTGGGSTYKVTLSNAAGSTLWTTDTRDTTVAVSADIVLAPDVEYQWVVDALLPQGTSRTSGPQSFRIAR
jgi:hypothetical protein